MINLTFLRSENVANNTYTFYFTSKKTIRYEAGQFIELIIPNQPVVQKRWFTLSSSPSESHLAITTRIATASRSPYKQLLHNLKPGDPLIASEPMGDFVLPLDTTIPLIFVAAGLGITPVRSMLTWLADSGQDRSVQLLYAVSDPGDFAFSALFDAANIQTTYIATKTNKNWPQHTGRLDAARIITLTNQTPGTLIYISGPELMVETITKDLVRLGINPLRIISDYFLGYAPV